MVTKSKPPISAVEAETDAAQPSAHVQADNSLAEALPNTPRYDEQTVIVKFGGHAMG